MFGWHLCSYQLRSEADLVCHHFRVRKCFIHVGVSCTVSVSPFLTMLVMEGTAYWLPNVGVSFDPGPPMFLTILVVEGSLGS